MEHTVKEVVHIHYDIDGHTIKDAINNLKELAEKYGDDRVIHLDLDVDQYEGYSNPEMYINIERPETPTETARRIRNVKVTAYLNMRRAINEMRAAGMTISQEQLNKLEDARKSVEDE